MQIYRKEKKTTGKEKSIKGLQSGVFGGGACWLSRQSRRPQDREFEPMLGLEPTWRD